MNRFTLVAGTTLAASSAMAQIPMPYSNRSVGITMSYDAKGERSGSTFDMNIVLEDNTIKFSRTNSTENQLTPEMIAATHRYAQLVGSFSASKLNYPACSIDVFRDLANIVCNIPFKTVISSYNPYDESVDLVLKMDFNINLSISKFIDDDDDNVVFSIHRHKRLIVSNEMPLRDVEVKMITLINELTEKYA